MHNKYNYYALSDRPRPLVTTDQSSDMNKTSSFAKQFFSEKTTNLSVLNMR